MAEHTTPPAGTGSAAPAVLREILRTPAFRELIRIQLDSVDGETGRELVRTLVEEDAQLPMELAGCSPGAIDAAISTAAELGRRLSMLPEPLLQAYVDDILADLDGDAARELPLVWGPLLVRSLPFATSVLAEATAGLARSLDELEPERRAAVAGEILEGLDAARLGGAVNALSALVIHAQEDTPDALREAAIIGQLMDEIDSGKLRKAAAAASGMGRDAALTALEHGLDDPVVLANTVVAIAPLINDTLAVAAGLLDKLELPDEILASALFRMLADLDGRTMGQIATGAAAAINGIHAGSMTLGATEPAFRATLADLLDEVLETVDGAVVGRALVALGEDGETLAAVVADWIRRDPSVVRAWVATATGTGAPLLRGATVLVREAGALGDEELAGVSRAVTDGIEPRELARLINELTGLLQKLHDRREDDTLVREFVAELDWDVLGAYGETVVAELAREGARDPWMQRALEPGAIGDRINRVLRRFNRYMEQDADENPVLQVMAAVDPAELEQAWRNMMGLLSGTMLSRADQVRAVFRPAVGVGLQSMKLVAFPSRKTRAERPEGRRRFPWIGSNR